MNHKRFRAGPTRLRTPRRLERLEVERVVDLCLEDLAATSVLDVGTGSGVFAQAFATRGLAVTGIDVSQEMLNAARQFVPTGRFEMAAGEAIPYPDDSYDLAFLGQVLHESDKPPTVLREALRAASQRVAVLEWPWREEEAGPPLAHRIPPERMAAMAREVGYSKLEIPDLAYMALYRLHL